jgi:enolase
MTLSKTSETGDTSRVIAANEYTPFEILDSRGLPVLRVSVHLDKGLVGTAADADAPSAILIGRAEGGLVDD